MNNSLVLLLVGAIVLVGGGYFLYTNYSAPREAGETMMEEDADAMQSSSGTLASLIASGQSLECTFEHDDGTNMSSGTVYLASGAERIRGDFTMQQGDADSMEAHVIRDAGYNYVWGAFYPQGVKTKITEENEGKLFDDKDGAIDEDTTFNCKSWQVDSSKFRLPIGVEFMDVSMQMEQVDDAMSGMKAQQCAACGQIPAGSGREQCLQALGC